MQDEPSSDVRKQQHCNAIGRRYQELEGYWPACNPCCSIHVKSLIRQ